MNQEEIDELKEVFSKKVTWTLGEEPIEQSKGIEGVLGLEDIINLELKNAIKQKMKEQNIDFPFIVEILNKDGKVNSVFGLYQ